MTYHTPIQLGLTPKHFDTPADCLRACELIRQYMQRKVIRVPIGKRAIQALEIKAHRLTIT
jgi:hypothetical protein